MSGITSVLDTLLHQVLGRRVDTPIVQDLPTPVSPATSSDAIQPARSDSRLHPQSRESAAVAVSEARERNGTPISSTNDRTQDVSTRIHLSRAATEISDILLRFPSSQASAIRPLAPLLTHRTDGPDALAGALSRSVAESGVFYESHLVRWLEGVRPRRALWREPQAWLGLTFRPPARALPALPLQGSPFLQRSQQPRDAGHSPAAMMVEGEIEMLRGDAASMARGHQVTQHASESLQTLVRHQLELIVSPELRWEGQLWPNVPMSLVFLPPPSALPAPPDSDADGDDSRYPIVDAEQMWGVDIRIDLPSLGSIDIAVQARSGGDFLARVKPTEPSTARMLNSELASFRERLTTLGLALKVSVDGAHG